MLKYYLYIALFVVIGGTVYADRETVTVEFSVLAMGTPVREKLGVLDQSGEFIPLRVQTRFRSEVYRYSGSQPLRLYSQAGDEDEGGAVREVAAFEIEEGVDRILILVFASQGDMAFRLINDDVSNFNFGSYRYINMTDRSLGVMHGTSRFLLRASDVQTVTPNAENGSSYSLRIAEDGQDGVVLIHSTSNRHNPEARTLNFVTEYNPPRRAVRVVTVAELPGEIVVLDPSLNGDGE